MGLALVETAPDQDLKDLDVGALWRSGIVGGLIGVLLTILISVIAQLIGRAAPWGVTKYVPYLLSIVIWKVGPLLFAVFCGLWIYLKGRRLGLTGRWQHAVFGSVLGVGVGFFVTAWSNELAIIAFLLLCPFLAARFAFGFMAPWWSKKKIAVIAGLVILFSTVLVFAKRGEWFQTVNPKTPIYQPTALLFTETGRLLLSTKSLGLLYTDDLGRTWTRLQFPDDAGIVTVLATDSEGLVYAASDRGLFTIADTTVARIPQQLEPGVLGIYPPNRGNQALLLGTKQGVWRITPADQSWSPSSAGLFTILDDRQAGAVSTIVRGAPSTVFAGVFGGGVFSSTDEGLNWNKCGHGLLEPWVQRLVNSKQYPDLLFASVGSRLYRGTTGCTEWVVVQQVQPLGSISDLHLWTDADGREWLIVVGQFGLVKLDQTTMQSTTLFDLEHGVLLTAINEAGNIAVTTLQRLYIYSPREQHWQLTADLTRLYSQVGAGAK